MACKPWLQTIWTFPNSPGSKRAQLKRKPSKLHPIFNLACAFQVRHILIWLSYHLKEPLDWRCWLRDILRRCHFILSYHLNPSTRPGQDNQYNKEHPHVIMLIISMTTWGARTVTNLPINVITELCYPGDTNLKCSWIIWQGVITFPSGWPLSQCNNKWGSVYYFCWPDVYTLLSKNMEDVFL